jgi:hypothetical protein
MSKLSQQLTQHTGQKDLNSIRPRLALLISRSRVPALAIRVRERAMRVVSRARIAGRGG